MDRGLIREVVLGAIQRWERPPLPFLLDVRLALSNDAFNMCMRINGDMRFDGGRSHGFAALLRDAAVEILRRGGRDEGVALREIARLIADEYFFYGQQEFPGAVMPVTRRMADLPLRYGMETEPIFEAFETEPWIDAARRAYHEYQRRNDYHRRGRDDMAASFAFGARRAPRNGPNFYDGGLGTYAEHAFTADLLQQAWDSLAGPPAESPAQQEARRAAATRAAQKRDDAEMRGYRLLVENLTPAQRACYEERGYFDVIGGKTKTTYRIVHGKSGNIIVDPEGAATTRKKGLGPLNPLRGFFMADSEFAGYDAAARTTLCIVPVIPLVKGDVMLGQKLAIELEEKDVLAKAIPSKYSVSFIEGMLARARHNVQREKANYERWCAANTA